jgi:tetratricopeptide (TPR) repeat protein
MTRSYHSLTIAALLALGGCAVPSPFQTPSPQGGSTPQSPAPVETHPAPAPEPVEPATPLPPPVREPSLSNASRALVTQAQSQAASGNYAMASGTIERALRIEPSNPLLWIELGKVRQADGNFVQAENMARKALNMAGQAPKAQSAAWRLISDSYRGRGRNSEARDAMEKAEQLATS